MVTDAMSHEHKDSYNSKFGEEHLFCVKVSVNQMWRAQQAMTCGINCWKTNLEKIFLFLALPITTPEMKNIHKLQEISTQDRVP